MLKRTASVPAVAAATANAYRHRKASPRPCGAHSAPATFSHPKYHGTRFLPATPGDTAVSARDPAVQRNGSHLVPQMVYTSPRRASGIVLVRSTPPPRLVGLVWRWQLRFAPALQICLSIIMQFSSRPQQHGHLARKGREVSVFAHPCLSHAAG